MSLNWWMLFLNFTTLQMLICVKSAQNFNTCVYVFNCWSWDQKCSLPEEVPIYVYYIFMYFVELTISFQIPTLNWQFSDFTFQKQTYRLQNRTCSYMKFSILVHCDRLKWEEIKKRRTCVKIIHISTDLYSRYPGNQNSEKYVKPLWTPDMIQNWRQGNIDSVPPHT